MDVSLAAQLFPDGVVCVECSPLPEGLGLHPLEAAAVSRANARRRREFATGRWLARKALTQLGFPDGPLPVGSDRAPLWPVGSVGSISHTDDYCVAVVATNPPYRSLGIDAEPAIPLEESLWTSICTTAELDWLNEQPPGTRGLLCHLLFAIKEAVYKYQAPISRSLLEFHDVQVAVDRGTPGFRAVITRDGVPGFPAGVEITGRFLMSGGLILAGAC